MKYDIRDVVITSDVFGGHEYVILEITNEDPPEYRAINKKNKKTYVIAEVQIADKIGTVKEDSKWVKDPDVFYDVSAGKEYAEAMANKMENEGDRQRWLALSSLNPGDHIKVVHRRNLMRVKFRRINLHKPRYAFVGEWSGKTLNFPLDAIFLQ
jgi:hypothetical protein